VVNTTSTTTAATKVLGESPMSIAVKCHSPSPCNVNLHFNVPVFFFQNFNRSLYSITNFNGHYLFGFDSGPASKIIDYHSSAANRGKPFIAAISNKFVHSTPRNGNQPFRPILTRDKFDTREPADLSNFSAVSEDVSMFFAQHLPLRDHD
jgi:hypothetical protein